MNRQKSPGNFIGSKKIFLREGGSWTITSGGGYLFQFNPSKSIEDFEETGQPSDWTQHPDKVADFDNSEQVWSGDKSLKITEASSDSDKNLATWTPVVNGVAITYVEIYVYEGGGSNGGGFALEDGDGNDVCGWASSNPDWHIWNANGWKNWKPGFETNDVWWRFRIDFDWSAGTFDINGEQFDENKTSTNTASLTSEPLINSTNVERLAIRGFGIPSRSWGATESHLSYYDDITIKL